MALQLRARRLWPPIANRLGQFDGPAFLGLLTAERVSSGMGTRAGFDPLLFVKRKSVRDRPHLSAAHAMDRKTTHETPEGTEPKERPERVDKRPGCGCENDVPLSIGTVRRKLEWFLLRNDTPIASR